MKRSFQCSSWFPGPHVAFVWLVFSNEKQKSLLLGHWLFWNIQLLHISCNHHPRPLIGNVFRINIRKCFCTQQSIIATICCELITLNTNEFHLVECAFRCISSLFLLQLSTNTVACNSPRIHNNKNNQVQTDDEHALLILDKYTKTMLSGIPGKKKNSSLRSID